MKLAPLLGGLSVLMLASTAHAGNPAVEATIHQMMEGFNKADIKGVKALHVASPTITDEFGPPFLWTGPMAFDHWLAGLTRSEAAEGKTGGVVYFGPPVRESVTGDAAYVVSPCTYTYKQNGKAFKETGTTTFVLVKLGGGWKIKSWTWASPEGVPVK